MATLRQFQSPKLKFYFYSVLDIAAKKMHGMERWGGSGFGIDITGTCPVLTKQKDKKFLTKPRKRDNSRNEEGQSEEEKTGKKKLHVDMLFDLAVNQTCVSLHDRDRASSLRNMSLHS